MNLTNAEPLTTAHRPASATEPIALTAVTAVIVNWETPEFTVRAARALLEDGLQPAQLVIVDNGSKDGSYEKLVRELPGCTMVALDDNIGYGRRRQPWRPPARERQLPPRQQRCLRSPRGNGARHAAGAQTPSVAIVVPRSLNEDLTLQRTVSAVQTPRNAFARASGLSRLIPKPLATLLEHALGPQLVA